MDLTLGTSRMVRADELSKSQFVTISGRPCRITSITSSSTSHNIPIIHIVGTDITTVFKAQSFTQNPQQTYSLYVTPKALVPVPTVGYIRADRLQIGDYVNCSGLMGYITHLELSKAGLRDKIHAAAKEIVTGGVRTGILWDDQLIETPSLQSTEFRLLNFMSHQAVEVASDGVNVFPIGSKDLAFNLERFWEYGKREVWVTVMIGGVVGAFEVRELEALGLVDKSILALKGRGRIPDTIIKKPMGAKGDKIDGMLRDGKRFTVKVRADMGHEESWDGWVVVDGGVREIPV